MTPGDGQVNYVRNVAFTQKEKVHLDLLLSDTNGHIMYPPWASERNEMP